MAEEQYGEVDDEGRFYMLVTEAQAVDIASGYVPNEVIAQVRCMLDWQRQDQLRAARPVQPVQKRKKAS